MVEGSLLIGLSKGENSEYYLNFSIQVAECHLFFVLKGNVIIR